MTFSCGPVNYVKKAGFSKKRRKEISRITDWFIDNFSRPIRKEYEALFEDKCRREETYAISKNFDLPFRWIQVIYELLEVGLLTLAQDDAIYYELKLFCRDQELPEMQKCYAKFKKVVDSVKSR